MVRGTGYPFRRFADLEFNNDRIETCFEAHQNLSLEFCIFATVFRDGTFGFHKWPSGSF
jgi:hypothetical protein